MSKSYALDATIRLVHTRVAQGAQGPLSFVWSLIRCYQAVFAPRRYRATRVSLPPRCPREAPARAPRSVSHVLLTPGQFIRPSIDRSKLPLRERPRPVVQSQTGTTGDIDPPTNRVGGPCPTAPRPRQRRNSRPRHHPPVTWKLSWPLALVLGTAPHPRAAARGRLPPRALPTTASPARRVA